ncbi:MAG: PAS domain S-box protein, partial [Desulfobacteraceae bacterium]|nr:PAS domain S-box protein [Desulfobacteraceae bacterium]
MGTPLNVLILEDNPADAELMVNELRNAGFDPNWHRVETEDGFRQHLEPALDIILADYKLPQFTGLQALEILADTDLDIPVIVVTGMIEETALKCMRRGAIDYLLKDRLGRLGPAVSKALEERRVREDRNDAIEAIRASEQRYRGLAETALAGITIVDPEERFTYTNPAFAEMLGYSPKELQGMSLSQIVGPEEFIAIRAQTSIRKKGMRTQYETTLKRKDGDSRAVIVSSTPLTSKDGGYEGAQSVITDITELKQAEDALRQSLEKTARSQQILLALSQAAETVQRERSATEIFQRIGDEIKELGFEASILMANKDLSALKIAHLTFGAKILRTLEKLAGVTKESFHIPLTSGSQYFEKYSNNKPLFYDSIDDMKAFVLPKVLQPLASKIASTL